MKKTYLFLLLLCSGKTLVSSQDGSIRVHQEWSPTISCLSDLRIGEKIINVTKIIKIHAKTIQERASDFLHHAKDFLWEHKYKVLGAGLLGAYAYALYNILHGNDYFARKDTWSTWRTELSNQDLAFIPQEKLALDLMAEIQRRHVTIDKPTDFLSPVAQFMQAAKKEISQLERYDRLYRWTSKIYLSPLLPFNRKKFASAQQKIERLLYLQHCAATWLAQYKMVINMPEAH
ncbi:hypothetical protein ACFLX2_00390 [Candidatus Dependentiae bacterium]